MSAAENAAGAAVSAYTYSPLPTGDTAAQQASQLAADAALAHSIAETEAALQREREAAAAAHRAATRARNLDDAYYAHGGYYYGTWRGAPYRPVVVHHNPADEYFLCIFLSSLLLIIVFIIVIIVLYAVYADDDTTTDDASSRRLLDSAPELVQRLAHHLLDSYKHFSSQTY